MKNINLSRFSPSRLLFISVCCVLFSAQAFADQNALQAFYTQLKPLLDKNSYGIPVYINSSDENNTMTGSIYGVIHHPFGTLVKAVRPAANWCDIAPQHLNIKACTYQSVGKQCQLTFYSGRKFYEKADEVHQLAYRFEIREQGQDYIHLTLSADEGPAGTSMYRLHFKAIPLGPGRSFVYFSYSYQYNFITSMGMGTYLATLGSGKVGFSITGKDNKGKPVYIGGVRGIIERNAVRYYLAIKSYLDTINTAIEKRFEARINKWFELTEQHHLQLYEMDKPDYLNYKRQERLDQQRLQKMLPLSSATKDACQ